MTELFDHGYAVVIGVDSSAIRELALPTVAKDVQAVFDVLVHPERCAYRPENVRLLRGQDATRANILATLEWLRDKATADPDATAVLYYSGHGAIDKGRYYLIPFDVHYGSIYTDALPAEEFNSRVTAINARRFLVVFDCCHAGGVGAKEAGLETLDEAEPDLIAAEAFPIDLTAGDIPDYTGEPGDKEIGGELESLSDLSDGEGRAVLNSSTGAQKSYLRQDRSMSLFTYHFIEALTGHAPHHDDDTTVLVTDVMSWVTREVKKSAGREGRDQTPVMRTSGVFPVAQLLGGLGLEKGLDAPDPLAPLPSARTVVHGDHVSGDKVDGDKVGGDKITTGNIINSNAAIGRDSSVVGSTVGQSSSAADLAPLFAPLLALVNAQAPALAGKVGELQAQVGRGAAADDATVAGLLDDLARGAPGAGGLLRAMMRRPEVAEAAGGPATRFVLGRIPD